GAAGLVLNEHEFASFAETNATVFLNTPAQPTDPLFDKEWFLAAADILPIWNDYTGQGVRVGVFDPTGNVDFSHADLSQGVTEIKTNGQPGIQAIGDHATLVAGVVAAARNGTGAVGVAYGVTLGSEALSDGQTIRANFALLDDWKNYDVVNNSWTPVGTTSQDLVQIQSALFDAAAHGRQGLGTAIVVGAGNDGALGENTDDSLLSNSPYAITVGGISQQHLLGAPVDDFFDNVAAFSRPGPTVLVSAPAADVLS